jgi:hypothetical protein
MKIEYHIAVSSLISGILYVIFKSWGLSVASLISGIFLDLDHAIDYFLEKGFSINIREILHFFYKEKHQKITLIFHGWEWLTCLVIAAALTDFNPWVSGALIGCMHHMILDYLSNKAPFLTYSFVWRWKNNFNSMMLFPRDRGYNPKAWKQERDYH